ncbi:MAG TPA: hypothetical protein VGC42_09660, partial [Kofleriaceae bacterium]
MMIATGACAAAGDDASDADLESGTVAHVVYNGAANQFGGSFHPTNAPYGGFGGGNCTASKTPVVFIHGNTVNASYIARPTSTGAATVYDTLKAAGYNDCELFGVTYLSTDEQGDEPGNYHTQAKAQRVRDFINDVKKYTGKSKVTVIAHSMGVTVALHGITYGNLWGSIDSFVNIAGGLRGLSTCLEVGYANPAFPTCGSQNFFDSNTFGFWPDGAFGASNPRTGTSASVGFRNEPTRRSAVKFFTISGGDQDEIVGGDQCRFNAATSLKSQVNLNIDHLDTFSNAGPVIKNMLTTTCT